MTFTEVCSHFRARRVGPGRAMARCPHHHDKRPSLSIRQGRKAILLHCFAGCRTDDILADARLAWSDLYEDGGRRKTLHFASPHKQRNADEQRKRGNKKYWDNLGETNAEPYTLVDVIRAVERCERKQEQAMNG
jgi:hypothetical protein